MPLTEQQIADFREKVWDFYRNNSRTMPWREDTRAYFVLVSELMLQQTQVERVIPKFMAFVERFPGTTELARAPLAEVLQLWNGLGYNRRAKFLWQAATIIEQDFAGKVPQTPEKLQALPGIGPNTAGAILTYAYNQPIAFVETNVRTVLFHHFFANYPEQVSDKELHEVALQVLDNENPRQWHWALMDYGAHLKKTAGGRLSQSRHYKKQAPLRGSMREMRGWILKELSTTSLPESQLRSKFATDERFDPALKALVEEKLIEKTDTTFRLHSGGVSQ